MANVNVNVNTASVNTKDTLWHIWELGTETGTEIKCLTKNLCWENTNRST